MGCGVKVFFERVLVLGTLQTVSEHSPFQLMTSPLGKIGALLRTPPLFEAERGPPRKDKFQH